MILENELERMKRDSPLDTTSLLRMASDELNKTLESLFNTLQGTDKIPGMAKLIQKIDALQSEVERRGLIIPDNIKVWSSELPRVRRV